MERSIIRRTPEGTRLHSLFRPFTLRLWKAGTDGFFTQWMVAYFNLLRHTTGGLPLKRPVTNWPWIEWSNGRSRTAASSRSIRLQTGPDPSAENGRLANDARVRIAVFTMRTARANSDSYDMHRPNKACRSRTASLLNCMPGLLLSRCCGADGRRMSTHREFAGFIAAKRVLQHSLKSALSRGPGVLTAF